MAVLVARPSRDAEGTQPTSPVQLELAQNLDLLRDLDLVGLEEPEDLEIVGQLHELEATP